MRELLIGLAFWIIPPFFLSLHLHRTLKKIYPLHMVLLTSHVLYISLLLVLGKIIHWIGVDYLYWMKQIQWIMLVVALILGLKSREWKPIFSRICLKAAAFSHLLKKRKLLFIFVSICAVFLIYNIVIMFTYPLFDYDGQWYHGGKIGYLNHKFHMESPADIHTYTLVRYVPTYPDNAEYFFSFLASLIGNSKKLRLAQLYFLFLSALALYSAMRVWKIPKLTTIILILGCVIMGSIIGMVQSLYVDLIFATFAFISCTRLILNRESKYWDITVILLSISLCIGTKFTGLIIFIALIAALAILNYGNLKTYAKVLINPRKMIPVYLACMVIATPIYIKNAIEFKNPFYPVKVSIFGHALFGYINVKTSEGIDGSPKNTMSYFYQYNPARKFFEKMRDVNFSKVPQTLRCESFGPVFFIIFLPSLLCSMFVFRKRQWLALFILIIIPLYKMQPVHYITRYIIFILLPFCIVSGLLLRTFSPLARKLILNAIISLSYVMILWDLGYVTNFYPNYWPYEFNLPPGMYNNYNSNILNHIMSTEKKRIFCPMAEDTHHRNMIYYFGRNFSNDLYFYKDPKGLKGVRPADYILVNKDDKPAKEFVSHSSGATYHVVDEDNTMILVERL